MARRRRNTTPAMSGTEAMTKLLVQIGEVVRVHDLEGFDPPGYEGVLVVLPGLTVGQCRALYPELHRRLLGYLPQPVDYTPGPEPDHPWGDPGPGVPDHLPDAELTDPRVERD